MQGYVTNFNKQKGFGFIRSDEVSKDIFVHISNIQDKESLVAGQQVTFEAEETPKGLAATQVIPGRKRLSPYKLYGFPAIIITIGITIFLIKYGCNALIAYIISINLSTFIFYGYDKIIAGTSLLRVPEWILHGLAISGGSPIALISQKVFHHKTIKESFQIAYWIIVIIQLMILIAINIW